MSIVMSDLSLFAEPRELLPFDGSAILFNQFFAEEFTRSAFDYLYNNTAWEQPEIVMFGKKHKQACLSTWHSDAGVNYVYSGVERVAHPMNEVLSEIRRRCETAARAKFNSVLVNLYRDGSVGMGWHADNEAVNGREPTIASVSLGATRRFDLRHRQSKHTVKVDLENGSLLVMSGLSQHCWVHQIAKTAKPVGARINLTFRLVREA
ncbi:MAG: alpha-ketoglutarate-dependent dioxygenase AlkB [Actinobacteria bacterium]|nr:alpha-ketoglutarate-dependent dioxygenase AlkB [Actinomycetota bacterium]